MNKQSIVVFLLLLLTIPISLECKRRKKIVPRFQTVEPQNKKSQEIKNNSIEKPEEIGKEGEEGELAKEIEEDEAEELEEAVEETEEIEEELEEAEETEKVEVEEAEGEEKEAPAKEASEKKDIYLNFENADLKTFVDYIGELKNINVIADPKISSNKISLTIRDPLTVDGAWNIFLTILEMSNYSIVKVGDVHKIIPQKLKLTEPLPTYINVPADTLPDSDVTIRYLTLLTNIPINQVKPLLESMLSKVHKVIPHANANGFVITDKSYNIKSAMKIIQELDRSDIKQSVSVMRLKQANAGDVKKLFDSLMQKPKGHPLARLLGRTQETSVEYFPPTTKIIAEPRTNSLILLGDAKSIQKIEEFVINHVDKELKGVKSPIHIYELQNTDVDQIKNILETITASQSSSPAAKHGGIRGGVKYFKKMKFAMDKQNNRLLVSSTDTQDWKLLKKTIKDLDKPQPQVALETMIVSVDFTKNKEFGTQIRSKKQNQLGRNVNFQAAHRTSVQLTENTPQTLLADLANMAAGLGSTVLTFGKSGSIWANIRLLQSQLNATVLSRPFIITTNLKEATIEVGETRRVVYQEAIAENSGNTGDAKGYENAKATLKVKVKPQINLDGVITLNIKIDIIDFIEQVETSPNTTEKKLQTKVSVANGQVLVLGGFVKTKISEGVYKTPLLGNIPLLGWLFKHKSREVKKEYIFIFMSPTIIKPRSTPGTNLYTKMKLYEAKDDISGAIEVKKTKDPIHNWFFNPEGETYSHKVVDFANARYQPTSVDIIEDPYYRSKTLRAERAEEKKHIEPEIKLDEEEKEEPETEETEEKEIEEEIEEPEEIEDAEEKEENEIKEEIKEAPKKESVRNKRRKRLKKLLMTQFSQPSLRAKRKTETAKLLKRSSK